MKSDAINFQVEPIRNEMNSTQQIPISHICYLYKRESTGVTTDKNLSQVCSTDEVESERVIANKSSTGDSKSERAHKSINTSKEKDEMDEIEY